MSDVLIGHEPLIELVGVAEVYAMLAPLRRAVGFKPDEPRRYA